MELRTPILQDDFAAAGLEKLLEEQGVALDDTFKKTIIDQWPLFMKEQVFLFKKKKKNRGKREEEKVIVASKKAISLTKATTESRSIAPINMKGDLKSSTRANSHLWSFSAVE